jgi:hypothetical protein
MPTWCASAFSVPGNFWQQPEDHEICLDFNRILINPSDYNLTFSSQPFLGPSYEKWLSGVHISGISRSIGLCPNFDGRCHKGKIASKAGMERGFFMDSDSALRYGIIDRSIVRLCIGKSKKSQKNRRKVVCKEKMVAMIT